MTTMARVAAGNIQNRPLMPQDKVREDTKLLFSLGLVVLACEVKVLRYDRAFRQFAHRLARRVYFEKRPTQAAVPKSWRSWGRAYRLTRGLAGINPARWFNAVFCPESRTIYVSTHFTNGGWNAKPKRRKAWRRWAWRRQERKARALIAEWNAKGWNVVVGGDLNRVMDPDFHSRQVTVVQAGIMHIIAIPAPGNKVVSRRARITRNVNGDHPFVSVEVGFEEKPYRRGALAA